MFDALNLLLYQIITFDLTLLSSTKINAAAYQNNTATILECNNKFEGAKFCLPRFDNFKTAMTQLTRPSPTRLAIPALD